MNKVYLRLMSVSPGESQAERLERILHGERVHVVYGIGKRCRCGAPAMHRVDEMIPTVRIRFSVYLCCRCFSRLMGPRAEGSCRAAGTLRKNPGYVFRNWIQNLRTRARLSVYAMRLRRRHKRRFHTDKWIVYLPFRGNKCVRCRRPSGGIYCSEHAPACPSGIGIERKSTDAEDLHPGRVHDAE